jgi:hypothetical protein
MKWIWSTAIVMVAVSTTLAAQSARDMSEATMGDGVRVTYTGCVEAVNHGGSFLLTHIGQHAAPMTDHDDMMATAVALSGRSDLKKHVGQKVTISGTLAHAMADEMKTRPDTLTVASLKVVAKSCS